MLNSLRVVDACESEPNLGEKKSIQIQSTDAIRVGPVKE